MILSKIELTPQEIKDQADLWAQAEEKLNQHTEVMREIKGTEKGKKPSVEAIKKGEELISSANELFRQIDAIKGKAEQRYIDSFKGDTDAILRDAEQIINLIEIADYYQDLERKKRLHADYLEKAPSKDAPKKAREHYYRIKNATKRGFNTYCYFMYTRIRVQLNALTFYGMSQEDIEASIGKVIESKAEAHYKRPSRQEHVILEAERPPYFGEDFTPLLQNTATNALTKLKADTSEGGNTIIDKITGVATITNGENFQLSLENFSETTGLRTSTHQLFDVLVGAVTQHREQGLNLTIPLKEYMEIRGLKDRKEAHKQVEADLDTLSKATMKIKAPKKNEKGETDFFNLKIIGSNGIIHGQITAFIDGAFYSYIKSHAFVMPYPIQLLKQTEERNNKKTPNSWYFGRRITEHKNMNIGKPNENIIAVRTLLEASPFIPSYEEVMKKGKQLNQRIIEPFKRDMDALRDILTWEFRQKNGAPLAESQLAETYNTFIELNVRIFWNSYPDTTARLERKKEKIEKAQEAKKKKKGQKKN